MPQQETTKHHRHAMQKPSHNIWLAMGVIVTRWVPPFRRRTLSRSVAWRYVTTDSKHAGDSRFAVVSCPDVFFTNATQYGTGGRSKITMGFQFSCFCKTVSWFRIALSIVPSARFIGKMEDDSALHDARVVAELMNAHRLARRDGKAPLMWYGHFAWALFFEGQDGRAKFCGDADDHLLSSFPRVCARAAPGGVLAPFASGGLDIRSRALAERIARCDELWEFVRGYNVANASYGASCDGQQGYFVAKCLALPRTVDGVPPAASASVSAAALDPSDITARTRVATALHLPWPKFHPASRRHGARLHTSLLHPHRPCVMHPPREGRGLRKSDTLQNLCENPSPQTWRWNLGQGLLPLRFHLHGEVTARPDASRGLPSLWWEPHNRTLVRTYNRLHARKEDDRYCDALPCGVALPTTTANSAAANAAISADAADVNAVRPANVSACATMLECFSGEGGRYWYQGQGPRQRLLSWS